MTRINCIPVSELSNVHLLAEHREIKRIPNVIASWRYKIEGIPKVYILWTWHVKFFYDKLGWLYERYIQLYKECISRWFSITFYGKAFEGCPGELFGGYEPTAEARRINRKRIAIRNCQSRLKKIKKTFDF